MTLIRLIRFKKTRENNNIPAVYRGRKTTNQTPYNVAYAAFRDLPGQADDLINRMRSRSDIDMDNDWKVITMFIGGNDLCSHCQDRVSPQHYQTLIHYALNS